ncbi:MAG: transporter [Verrucomicrobia subdivision 3 bacterium]|nr:transporter [Limisphaerales bacterium]
MSFRQTVLSWVAGATALIVPLARAQEQSAPAIDKSGYHLLNPTPSQYLRELTIDGPGATESPYTVDAGHFQVEMTFVSYATQKETFGPIIYRRDAWSFAPMTLKMGLLNNLDAQVILEPYNHIYEREDDLRLGGGRPRRGEPPADTRVYSITRRGFGDTTVRLKYNLWGNDEGDTALAVMPFVKLPTSQDEIGHKHVEGGLMFPFEAALPGSFYLGFTTRLDATWDEEERNYDPEFINSVALSRDLFWDLSAYVEFFNALSRRDEDSWISTFDAGLLYWLTDDLQLNAGVNIGISRDADDWNPFIGMAWRF